MAQNNGISAKTAKEITKGLANSNETPAPAGTQAAPPPQYLDGILAVQSLLKERKAQPVSFSKPIVTHNGNAVIYPNTLVVVQGQTGAHKSRLAELLCAVLLGKNNGHEGRAGFQAAAEWFFSICVVDTERNLTEQLPYALQSIQMKAGFQIDEHPDGFDYISLMDVPRKERFAALKEYLEHVRKNSKGHIFIVLDVLSDCCADFNRPDDSLQLIDELNKAINTFNVTFLAVIHENPGHAKARGHLGTELTNKASTVIQVGYEQDGSGKDTDLIRVKFLKCRNTRRHEPFYMKYSDEEKGLVLADEQEVKAAAQQRKEKALITEVAEKVSKYLSEKPMKSKELTEILMKDFSCAKRTIEERLKEMIGEKTVLYAPNAVECTLERNMATYSLKPIEST